MFYNNLYGSLSNNNNNTAKEISLLQQEEEARSQREDLSSSSALPGDAHPSTKKEHSTSSSFQTPLVTRNNDKDDVGTTIINHTTKMTLWSGVVNLSNTIIGAGMLGLPGAFGGTGYLGGTILIVLGAAFSAHGLILLSKAAQASGIPSSFYTVAKAAVPSYTILIDLAVALKCFGVATGYLITIGDCMVDACDHLLPTANNNNNNDSASPILTIFSSLILSRRFWIVGAVLAVLPTSFYKTLDDLKRASALALVFVVLLVFGIVAYANQWADPCLGFEAQDEIMSSSSCQGEVVAFTNVPTTLAKLPIFIFAFTCHQNVFPIVNELQQRTQERLNIVVYVSIGLALLVFYVVAMEGYTATFGSNVRGDILLNYPETTKVTILRLCIAFMLSLHYPLQLDPSRRCITSLVKVVMKWKNERVLIHRHSSVIEETKEYFENEPSSIGVDYGSMSGLETPSNNDEDNNKKSGDTMFYIITISFLACSFVVAMIVDDLGVVLAMVGATGSTLVSYILPGLIYWKIHPIMDMSKIMALVQLSVGCILMPIALYYVILGKAKH